jgi:type I restriction enzyme R subunit
MADESERKTRTNRIDPELRWAGWQVVRFDPQQSLVAYDGCAITEYPTENGPADYALCVGGQILGIVEAKKLSLGDGSTNQEENNASDTASLQ